MSNDKLTPAAKAELVPTREHMLERVMHYASKAQAENTKKAYEYDWDHFVDFCRQQDLCPLPASHEAVAMYLTHMADSGFALSTLERRMTTIKRKHYNQQFDDPTGTYAVSEVWSGIRRELSAAQDQAAPLMTDDLLDILHCLDLDDLGDLRDRAILVLGLLGGFRRSELVALTFDDIERKRWGFIAHVRNSKTDQEGKGMRKAFHRSRRGKLSCPVNALDDWTSAAEITEGPLFRSVDRWGNVSEEALSAHSVGRIVKKRAAQAELSNADDMSAHSLRAGFLTQCGRSGVPLEQGMMQTGHKNLETAQGYVREGDRERHNFTDMLGL